MATTSDHTLKVAPKVAKRIRKLLHHRTERQKFNDLSNLYNKKYGYVLDLFTSKNYTVLDVVHRDNPSVKKGNNDMKYEFSEKEIKELQRVLNLVDFTGKFKNSIKKGNHNSMKNFVKINIHLPSSNRLSKIGKNITEVVNYFDRCNWKTGDCFNVSISNIYNPSTFWLRFGPVDEFQKLLWEFYNSRGNQIFLLGCDIQIGMNCVALDSDIFYRGKILKIDVSELNSYIIYLYDFGMIKKVNIISLYQMDKSFLKIPALAVRARLHNISTTDDNMWSRKAIRKFRKLLSKSKTFMARIETIQTSRKMLEVSLFDMSARKGEKIINIAYCLVKRKLAKGSYYTNFGTESEREIKPMKKNMFEYPTFEMIEKNLVPPQHYIKELKGNIPLDVTYPLFYKFQSKE